jgi:hypothetical protein
MLKTLQISQTEVTPAGEEALTKALPGLKISRVRGE